MLVLWPGQTAAPTYLCADLASGIAWEAPGSLVLSSIRAGKPEATGSKEPSV